MQGERKDRVGTNLRKLASDYIQKESSPESLITITRVSVGSNLKRATLFVTVYPDTLAEKALQYLRRKRGDIRNYIGKQTRMKVLPFIEFELDAGEKNRQRIDELTAEDKLLDQ